MKPFLVTATDSRGRCDSFVREADSLRHLRGLLEAEGFVDIEFLDDEFSAGLRANRPEEVRDDSREAARLEARLRTGPAPLTIWLLAARRNWLFLTVTLSLLVYAALNGRVVLALVSAAFFVGWVLLLRAAMRPGDSYDDLVRAQATGDLDSAEQLIEKLSAGGSTPGHEQLQVDLAFRRACLQAKRGDLAGALRSVEKWRSRPEAAGGIYETRCASIHYQADDMPGFVRGMEAGFTASGEGSLNLLDLAFAHARVGDAGRARELLSRVDRENVPAIHAPILQASEAMLLLRDGEAARGTAAMESAVEGFSRFAGNPAVWPIHGILVGWLSRALAAAGRREEAMQVLEPWRAAAVSCSDPEIRNILQTELAS